MAAGARKVHVQLTLDLDFHVELEESDPSAQHDDDKLAELLAEKVEANAHEDYDSGDLENFVAHASVTVATVPAR